MRNLSKNVFGQDGAHAIGFLWIPAVSIPRSKVSECRLITENCFEGKQTRSTSVRVITHVSVELL